MTKRCHHPALKEVVPANNRKEVQETPQSPEQELGLSKDEELSAIFGVSLKFSIEESFHPCRVNFYSI